MTKKFFRIFLLLAALFVVVRIIFLRQLSGTPLFNTLFLDSEFYYQWAHSLATGHGHPPGPFWLSPFYPFFMAALFAITGSITVKLVVVAQFVLSAGTLMLLALYTRKLFGDAAALVATAMAALYAPWLYYDGVVLSASLILFLNAAILYLLLTKTDVSEQTSNFKPQTSRWIWAVIGVLVGCSALARPSILIFAVLLILWIIKSQIPNPKSQTPVKARLSSVAVFAAAIAIVLIPVLVRNWVVAGSPVLTTSSGGVNFFIGNRMGATGMYDEFDFIQSFDPWREAEGYRVEAAKRSGHELTLTQASRFWMGQAIDDIIVDPLDWVILILKKAWLTIQREEIPTNVSFRGVAGFAPIAGALPLRWGLLFPLAVCGAFLIMRKSIVPERKVFRLYVIAYVLTNVLFFSSSEYRFPMILVLLPLAGFFLVSIWKLIEQKQVRELLTVCGIYIVALVISNFPSKEVGTAVSARADYYNLATIMVDQGKIPESIPLYARALTVDENYREARIGLAQSLWAMGNFDDARREFQAAGVRAPDYISGQPLQDFLEEIYRYTEEGKHDEALQFLKTTFPDDSDAPSEIWSTRAMLESDLGRIDDAVASLLKAAAKEPDDPEWLYRAGVLCAQNGDSARADSLYRKAIELYAAYAPARIEIALDALNKKDLTTARQQLDELERIRIPDENIRRRLDDLKRRVELLEWELSRGEN